MYPKMTHEIPMYITNLDASSAASLSLNLFLIQSPSIMVKIPYIISPNIIPKNIGYVISINIVGSIRPYLGLPTKSVSNSKGLEIFLSV